ncbi:MAG TPA: RICIN domain-containing protein [Chryseosolibacter sp.]|nr:RICIN domain-containing protein [Chryseosolibacter sp.]
MRNLSLIFGICILSLCVQVMFHNDALAYPNEVRQSGSSYIWRINDVDQGSTSSLATAINNCMTGSREIHILTGGTLTSTLTVRASNVKLYCHGNTFTRNFSGTGVINTYNGFEIHDMILRGGSNGYGIRSSRASYLKFINVQIYDCPWIGIRVDSRESEPWNYWVYDLEVKNCRFENIGSHGLETYSVDGVDIDGIVARHCGECGVLLNRTINGTVGTVDAYRCAYGTGYAGLRFANDCSRITANNLIARECGRGYFVLSGSNNCHLNNARITDGTGIGIWLENVTNCSVKAGCTNDGISVSGSGSYANVSTSCSDVTTYYRIQNRGTGLFLDGLGRTVNGEACGQYANTTHVNAQWERISLGGYYQFRNRGTGMLLDGMGRTTNGSDVGQYANTTSYNSQWAVQTYSGSYSRIQNRGTGLYLDGMGRTTNGSVCGQYANTTSYNAQWQLIAVSSSARSETEEMSEAVEEEEALVYVHPNPTAAEVTITLPDSYKDDEKTVNLLDATGKSVVWEKFADTKHTLYIGSLPQGLYVLNVSGKDRLIVKKLIKR